MDMTLLGSTGIRVSRLALGTMTFGSAWGWGADEKESRAIFDLYDEVGGNFIDTADIYTAGESETLLGRLLSITQRTARLGVGRLVGRGVDGGAVHALLERHEVGRQPVAVGRHRHVTHAFADTPAFGRFCATFVVKNNAIETSARQATDEG